MEHSNSPLTNLILMSVFVGATAFGARISADELPTRLFGFKKCKEDTTGEVPNAAAIRTTPHQARRLVRRSRLLVTWLLNTPRNIRC